MIKGDILYYILTFVMKVEPTVYNFIWSTNYIYTLDRFKQNVSQFVCKCIKYILFVQTFRKLIKNAVDAHYRTFHILYFFVWNLPTTVTFSYVNGITNIGIYITFFSYTQNAK